VVSGSVDIADVAARTGQADFALEFVLADRAGACSPTWGGKTAIDDSTVAASIGEITTAGGSAIVATGSSP
jgi:chitinase